MELSDRLTPEDVFERNWAQTLSERALGKLQGEWDKRGKSDQFRLYQGFLTGNVSEHSYDELAATLALTKGSTWVAVHRLRHRYAKLLREEIAGTVSNPTEIEDELRHVLEVLAA